MNWPEALTAMAAMLCLTFFIICWWLVREMRKEGSSPDDADFIERLRRHGLEVTVMEAKEDFIDVPTENVVTVREMGLGGPGVGPRREPEASDAETDLDNLAERLERLERRVGES